jgi:DNA-directed RNA polymerase subunit RPC12/RpoP
MLGRYGYDELSRCLFILAFAFVILSYIPILRVLYVPALVLLILSCVRCFSRNLEKRRSERAVYLRITGKIKGFFTLQKKKWSERRTHIYFKCSGCRRTLRIPKGKGKIRITCPGCGFVIEKRT